MTIPYDFFIDEDKQRRLIGVLAVPNAVTLDGILQSIRGQYSLGREIKWNGVDRIELPVAVSWVRVAGWYAGVKFACLPWPKNTRKGDILLAHLQSFLTSRGRITADGRYDSVVFMDFDQIDKDGRLHDYVRRRAKVLRCYVLDSKASNLIQLADLLLGCWATTGGAATLIPQDLENRWPGVETALRNKRKLTIPDFTGSESKQYLRAFSSSRLAQIRVS